MVVGRWPAACVVAAAVLAAASVSLRAEPRAIVELFTSQGCSSCPPADKLIGELRKDPTLVVVSLPVHYWDYLGWKDTLADPRHTVRQKAYARARGDGDVYTPQAVVNGTTHALGSDQRAIEQAVETAKGQGAKLSIPVDITVVDGQISVRIEPGADTNPGEVWLWGLASAIPVNIRRGENQGQTITYANVVRRWVKLGDWPGSGDWTVSVADVKADMVDTVAVIVQSGGSGEPGAIRGAKIAPLN